MRFIVLGGGLVGSVIAEDLARDGHHEVTLADVRPGALERASARMGEAVRTVQADLSDVDTLKRVTEPFDVVCGALASAIGYQSLRAVVECGKPFSDICFMPEDGWELDSLAKEHGARVVIDCGVAPGMSNLLAAYSARQMARCDRVSIYVGGIPKHPQPPFRYKAAFSPHDVLEEYIRPSRIVEHGRMVIREALTEPEMLDFAEMGQLEAFNTDGLRSLASTLDVPNMVEKTLRYPGHRALMEQFRAAGLFSQDPVEVDGMAVRPLDLTSAVLFPQWTYEPGEADLTIMRIVIEGAEESGSTIRHTWELHDEHDASSDTSSMARTTAFPCSIVARMLADETINEQGVTAPEGLAGNEDVVQRMLTELNERGVQFQHGVMTAT